MMVPRACIDCGAPALDTRNGRCEPCAIEHDRMRRLKRPRNALRGTNAQRGYNSAWNRLSARARGLQRFCSECGSTNDLTADHLRWPARTLADVDVLCRRCNSRKGAIRESVL